MASKVIFAGIDVGASELVVTARRNGKPGKVKTFTNTPEGHAAIISYLNPGKHPSKACLEATGMYHLDVAVALSRAPGIAVMVMNPKAVKNFANALTQRNKTDAVDAALLAEIAELLEYKQEFTVWQAPSARVLEIRACSRRLSELSQQKARAKNQLHALKATQQTPEVVSNSVKEDIKHLENQIEALSSHTLRVIEQDAQTKQSYELINGIKWIAQASAISILGEVLVLPNEMTARQWVAHAGLDPREHTSGSSVHKKARLSKAGNRHLRCALFMPALSATRHIPQVKAFYQHLTEGLGKKKMQAICAVMRKLLHALHGILKNRRPFDGAKFYPSFATA
jgi:transposase